MCDTFKKPDGYKNTHHSQTVISSVVSNNVTTLLQPKQVYSNNSGNYVGINYQKVNS